MCTLMHAACDAGAVDLRVRFAVVDSDVSGLHARAFGGDESRITDWGERLRKHALTWVGAFESETLVGFVQVAWDGGEHSFILDTAVDPRRRGRGIGAAVVKAAVEEAAKAGCVWVHVDFEPHLEEFYLGRCGFRPTSAGLIRAR
jgi:GNAT superfamily N-acetyltransferase